jgi:PqqD family protein of HPr-rel-A system
VPEDSPEGAAWRLNPAAQLHWRELDGEWVVFDQASGATHHLMPLAACALMCIEEAALSTDALARQVSEAVERPVAEVTQALQPLLALLAEAGLIDPQPA